jgi:tetratricopeptide (TPR) repeat protein
MLNQGSHMTATDQATQAARCALALRQRFPDSLSTLTTGRALLGGSLPLGEAFERSNRLRQIGLSRDNEIAAAPGEVIFLDGVTAGLLDSRFELRRLTSGVYALRGERASSDATRLLLGQPTLCVGRDRELAILDLLFSECKEDSMARVALIIAPAGMGKSRLRHEFLRRLRARHESVQVLMGRGDPLLGGSPYALLGQAVRQLCGILEGESPEAQQAKLWQHVQRRLPAAEARRVVEFVGEPCGIRLTEPESAQLLLARSDARSMTQQIYRAFIDLVRAECECCPVLLILEDLHWSDAPTVRLVDAMLRELGEHCLMVLALARPEVENLFPRLWAERRCQDLRLEGLSKKAGERLVRQVLGAQAQDGVMTRIVEQSAGNPLFLEELIRAVAEGKGDEMPETVLAMLQSRLLRLEPSARRLLRAASIFGQTFWRRGLTLLLRSEPGTVDVERWLHRLVDSEILEPQRESRYPSDPQYRFRHALLRDAAYSLLTVESRQLGHRLAVQYLEQLEDSDPVVLAEHCERGNDLARAGSLYLRAAELAHHRGDAETAVARARQGLLCQPDEIARLGLLVVLCQVHLWRNQWAQAAEFADELLRLSEPGSPSWAIAATAKLVDARYVHRHRFLSALDAVQKVEPEIDAVSTMAFALAIGIYILDSAGEFALAESCLQRLHDIVEPVAAYNPIARAWLNRAHAHREAWVHEDPWAGLQYSEATRACFLEANNTRGALDGQVFLGMNAWYLGAAEQAERELRGTLAIGDDLGLVSSLRTLLFIQVLCARGALEEAEREARALAAMNQAMDLTRGRGLWALGEVLFRRGDYAAAEQQLREALDSFVEAPLDSAAAQATLAHIQLAAGRKSEALASAEQAMQRFVSLGSFGYCAARVHLVYAQALDAVGNRAQARQIVDQARARHLQQAEKIGDPTFRKRFLEGTPEYEQLSELAEAWNDGR